VLVSYYDYSLDSLLKDDYTPMVGRLLFMVSRFMLLVNTLEPPQVNIMNSI